MKNFLDRHVTAAARQELDLNSAHFEPGQIGVHIGTAKEQDGSHQIARGLRGDTVLWVDDESLVSNTRSALSAAVGYQTTTAYEAALSVPLIIDKFDQSACQCRAVDALVLDALRPLLRQRRGSGLGGLAGRTDCMLARYTAGGPR